MLSTTIAWIVILFVLLSFGDMFISLYNKLCKRKERYNLFETFLLGMGGVLILLSLSSIWLPSDQYILFAFIFAGLIYWGINYKKLIRYFNDVTCRLANLSLLNKVSLVLIFTGVLVFSLFPSGFFDSILYHQQNIRWNEEFHAVPGLANLEDRFGFNSNYLLLSAIFTFRFLFNEPVYAFQSLLYVLLLTWVITGLFKSGYNIRYIVLLLLCIAVIYTGGYMISDTSTDIIPFLCIFYYIAKAGLSPNWLRTNVLFSFLLPVILIPFKLSTAIFCLVSLFILIQLIRNKETRTTFFLLAMSFIIVALWCVRNTIITGYLVFPLYEIDLFSFDWEVPRAVLVMQRLHIQEWARYILDIDYVYRVSEIGLDRNVNAFLGAVIVSGLFLLVAVSPLLVVSCLVKRIKIEKDVYLIYAISLLCILYGMLSAPDFRFINGYIFGSAFLVVMFILYIVKKENTAFPDSGNILSFVILLLFSAYCARMKQQDLVSVFGNNEVKDLLLKPGNLKSTDAFEEYQLDNITIYLTRQPYAGTYDMLPAVNPLGLPFNEYTGNKMQDIRTIQLRGTDIQNGFRTKEEYINILNGNVERYKSGYIQNLRTKYPDRYFENN